MDERVQRRVARNEDLFRQVNEGIAKGLWPGESEPVRFRCECARLDCGDIVELTPSVYEEVRRHPRRFVVIPGHERTDVERVVGGGTSYAVVEKFGAAGGKARELDPRG